MDHFNKAICRFTFALFRVHQQLDSIVLKGNICKKRCHRNNIINQTLSRYDISVCVCVYMWQTTTCEINMFATCATRGRIRVAIATVQCNNVGKSSDEIFVHRELFKKSSSEFPWYLSFNGRSIHVHVHGISFITQYY